MPPMTIARIYWGRNTAYATRRATRKEIEEVLLDHRSVFRRNLRGRAASHVAAGRTATGRPLTVAFIYVRGTRTAVPVNAWEK
jgi:hypothetical protein